jgi:hypothetical protein
MELKDKLENRERGEIKNRRPRAHLLIAQAPGAKTMLSLWLLSQKWRT